MIALARGAGAAALAALLAGCASAPSKVDPLEPMNRALYQVHDVLDTNIVKPVAEGYTTVVPKFVRTMVANVYNNIDDLFSAVNGLLQGKFDKAGNDLGRVLTNTLVGFGGLIDVASDAGIERGNEDFGQTFAVWGIPQGPYLFVPLFGPTTVRDGAGVIVRIAVGPAGYIPDVPLRNSLYGWATSTCARRRSTQAGSSTRRRSTATSSFAMRTCSGAAISSMTGSRRPNPRTINDASDGAFAPACFAGRVGRCGAARRRAARPRARGTDAMVKRVSQDVLASIKSDPLIQAGNEARIREVLEVKLLPHFDFTRMTTLAMGKNWRACTPEQQKRVTDEFRALLVRTYSGALNKYRDETIEYKPVRAGATDTDVTVRTLVLRPGGAPIQIDYGLEKKADGWKAYDVVVGGVSLVTNYRDEFNEQIRTGGVDGLIKTLADRNKGVAAK